MLSFDLRGHGKSEGIKGYFENKDIIQNDIDNFINMTESEYSSKNISKFIIGYSFGGLFANLTALARPNFFNGAILLAPALHNDSSKYTFWIKIARALNFIHPTFPLVNIKGII